MNDLECWDGYSIRCSKGLLVQKSVKEMAFINENTPELQTQRFIFMENAIWILKNPDFENCP